MPLFGKSLEEKISLNLALGNLWLQIKDKNKIYGLCHEIDQLSYHDYGVLKDYFMSQKPKWYRNSKFRKATSYIGLMYWWDNDFIFEATEQRKLFIRHLIDKVSKSIPKVKS
jgi:hypothetical protein